jgi:hypothetical protein
MSRKIIFVLIFSFLIRIVRGGVQTGSTRHVGHFWPIVPAPGDCEDGEFGGMKIGRGNRSKFYLAASLRPLWDEYIFTRSWRTH